MCNDNSCLPLLVNKLLKAEKVISREYLISYSHVYNTPNRRCPHPFYKLQHFKIGINLGMQWTSVRWYVRYSSVLERSFNSLCSDFCWGFIKSSSVTVQLKQRSSLIQGQDRTGVKLQSRPQEIKYYLWQIPKQTDIFVVVQITVLSCSFI